MTAFLFSLNKESIALTLIVQELSMSLRGLMNSEKKILVMTSGVNFLEMMIIKKPLIISVG